MKLLSFLRRTVPHSEAVYGDALTVYLDGEILGAFNGRTWPNPFRPADNAPFDVAYGGVAPGHYGAVFRADHPKFGRCFGIAGGNEVPGLWPNVNHAMRAVVDQVFVHRGETAGWSGSAACLTVTRRRPANSSPCSKTASMAPWR